MKWWGWVFVALVATLLTPDRAQAAVFYPTSFTLANGLQIVVVPNHLAPAINQMVWYKVGSADEVSGKTGLAHYLEHLMFRGTLTMEPGAFSKIIAAQGGSDNAFTAYDYTAFFVTVAADRLPMVMQMEADRMQNLHITEVTATPELGVILDERQERIDNNPQGRFEEELQHELMPHYPYGIPVIGWKPDMESFNVADATAFYQHHYAPNNAVVVISGDVDPQQVMSLAASIYGVVPRRDVEARASFPALSDPTNHRLVKTDVGVEQPQMQMNIVVPSYSTQKKNEAYALEVLAEALDGGEVGILYRKLVAEKNLASNVETNYDPDARGDAIFTLALTPAPSTVPEQLETALNHELQELAQKGLAAKSVEDAKKRLERSALFARDSLMTPGYVFGMALTTGHKVSDVEAWPDRIKAVTPEDVHQALRDLVKNKHFIVASLLPDPNATAAAREAATSLISHDRGIR